MKENKYYSIPYISNSALTYFEVSPKYCRKRMDREIADIEKSYTFLGKQLHMNLLEPEEFERNYTYLDFNTPKSKQQQAFCADYVDLIKLYVPHEDALKDAYEANYVSSSEASILKFSKNLYETNSEYIKYLQIKGDYREILSKSRKELITTITQAIKSHKKANTLILCPVEGAENESLNEFAVYWDYPINGNGENLKCKSLIDRLVVDHINKRITIVDLKTTGILGDFSEIISERNYWRQLAFYRLAIQHSNLFPKDYKIDSYIVAVNTLDPFECRVYKLTDVEYHKQLMKINSLMLKISWHWFSNQWDHTRAYYEGDGTENHVNE